MGDVSGVSLLVGSQLWVECLKENRESLPGPWLEKDFTFPESCALSSGSSPDPVTWPCLNNKIGDIAYRTNQVTGIVLSALYRLFNTAVLLPSFYRRGSCGIKRLNNFLEVTQLLGI